MCLTEVPEKICTVAIAGEPGIEKLFRLILLCFPKKETDCLATRCFLEKQIANQQAVSTFRFGGIGLGEIEWSALEMKTLEEVTNNPIVKLTVLFVPAFLPFHPLGNNAFPKSERSTMVLPP